MSTISSVGMTQKYWSISQYFSQTGLDSRGHSGICPHRTLFTTALPLAISIACLRIDNSRSATRVCSPFGGPNCLIRMAPNYFDAITGTITSSVAVPIASLKPSHTHAPRILLEPILSLITEHLRSSLGRMLQTTIVNERDASGRNVATQVNERRILKVHDSQPTGMISSRLDLHRFPQLLQQLEGCAMKDGYIPPTS